MPRYIGQEIGGYRVLEQIGAGGMAKVYKAYQPGMDRLVALKILPETYAEDGTYLQRFKQEAQVIARLEHKHILPVYDYGEEGKTAFLAMRYLQAGTLKDILHRSPRGRLPVKDVVRLVGQIAQALDHAHSQGIVHRDIKPSNILIDSEGDTYLMDFGIAKVLETTQHLTSTGSTLGTPAYMSPEQGAGKEVDGRSDLYSLGIMLYQMLVGQVPFDADTPYAVVIAHINDPLPLPRQIKPDIHEELEKVILKSLAKGPEDRYQSGAALMLALRRVLEEMGEDLGNLTVSPELKSISHKAAEGLSSEEITVDDLELVKTMTRKERVRKIMPWAIGIIAVLVFSAVGLFMGRSQGEAGAQANATLMQAASSTAFMGITPSPTFEFSPTPTLYPTYTPEPSPTAIPLRWKRITSLSFLDRDRVTALAIHPEDSDIMYAGMARSGVYKTINGGDSWEPIQNGLDRAWITTIAINPENPDEVFAGALYSGLYRTQNGGETWELLNTRLGEQDFWQFTAHVAMNPANPQHLAFTGGWGVTVSVDGGDSWTLHQIQDWEIAGYDLEELTFVISTVAIDPTTGNLLLTVEDFEHNIVYIFVSEDGGSSWEVVFTRTGEHNIGVFSVNPFSNEIFYHNFESYASTDGGKTWERSQPNYFPWLISSNGTYYSPSGNNLEISTNLGQSWRHENFGNGNRITAGAVSNSAPEVAAVGSIGVFITRDNGQTWTESSNGLGATPFEIGYGSDSGDFYLKEYDCENNCSFGSEVQFYRLSVDLKDHELLSSQNCKTNFYTEWGQALCLNALDDSEDRVMDVFYPHPADTDYVYASFGPGFNISVDAGETWSECDGQFSWLSSMVSSVAFHPTDPETLFAATTTMGLLKTDFSCSLWIKGNGLKSNHVNSVVINPLDPNKVYAATDSGVFVSYDEGENWGAVNDGLLGALSVYSLAIDPQNPDNVYAGTPYGIFFLENN